VELVLEAEVEQVLEQVLEQAPEALVELDFLVQVPERAQAPEALVELVLEQERAVSQEMEAGEDPQAMEAGEDPQAMEAGEDPQAQVDQLLSCCVRRLDTMVQVGTGRALLGRQQLG